MDARIVVAIGVLGNVLLALAYLPQIRKTIVSKSAEDLSLSMWVLYVLGDICLLAYSMMTGDAIFTALFTLFTVENAVVLYLAVKYGKVKPKA